MAGSRETSFIQIQWTCASIEEAKKICFPLVEQRKVACVSIFPQIESIYVWEGKVVASTEVKVFLKTTKERFAQIQSYILDHCSYRVPEILVFPILDGNPSYLQWMAEATTEQT